MKLEVDVSKKYAFAIVGALLIIAGVIGIVAYGGTEPTVVGHSAGEIEGAGGGSSIKVYDSGWVTYVTSKNYVTGADLDALNFIGEPDLMYIWIADSNSGGEELISVRHDCDFNIGSCHSADILYDIDGNTIRVETHKYKTGNYLRLKAYKFN